MAVKIIRDDLSLDPLARARFFREAEVSAHLKHDHILPLFEFGEFQGRLFLVTPYISGGTLAQRLHAGLPSLAEVQHLFTALAQASWNTGIRLSSYKPSSITSKVWLALMHAPTSGNSQVWMRTRSRSPFTPCLVTATYCLLVCRRSKSFPSTPQLCLLPRFLHYPHLPSLQVARRPPFSQGQHRSQGCDGVNCSGTCTAALFRMNER